MGSRRRGSGKHRAGRVPRTAPAALIALVLFLWLVLGQAGLATAFGGGGSGSGSIPNGSHGSGGSATSGQTSAGGSGTVSGGVVISGSGGSGSGKSVSPSSAPGVKQGGGRGRHTPPTGHKVTICHATDSFTNPYVQETVDIASSGLLQGGHNGHTGPIFYSGIPKGTKWGDIIPPYDYAPASFTYPGLNWSSGGQTIWNAGCKITPPPTPQIQVLKSCPASAGVGDTISYTITVNNLGGEDLNNITVSDPMLGNISSFFPNTLAVGGSASHTFSYTIATTDPNVLHNVATASADGVTSQTHVTDSDSCDTNVTHTTGINVTKSCPESASVGDTITYTITVSNTGNEPLSNVSVSDPMLSGSSLSGFAATLAVGDSASHTFDFTISPSSPDPIHNVVTAFGKGSDSLKSVSSTDSCDTSVPQNSGNPAIRIVKSGPSAAHVGDTITYTLDVSNPGDVSLSSVAVNDPVCDAAPVLQSKTGGNQDSSLDPGETWHYTCTHVVTVEDPNPLPNTATTCAAAQPEISGPRVAETRVCDTGSHQVDILHPAIQLLKTANGVKFFSGDVGQTVTYRYAVTNTGDTTLFGIQVTDDQLGTIGTISSLAPGNTVTLSKHYALKPGDTTLLTNVGTASGHDELQQTVTATDSAKVIAVLGKKVCNVGGNTYPAGDPRCNPAPVVAHASGTLPFTGAKTLPYVLTFGALVLAGTALALVSRRRRVKSEA